MIEKTDDKVLLTGCHAFSPEQTFNCGQCFRFEKGRAGVFEGIAFGRRLRVGAEQGGTAITARPRSLTACGGGILTLTATIAVSSIK